MTRRHENPEPQVRVMVNDVDVPLADNHAAFVQMYKGDSFLSFTVPLNVFKKNKKRWLEESTIVIKYQGRITVYERCYLKNEEFAISEHGRTIRFKVKSRVIGYY